MKVEKLNNKIIVYSLEDFNVNQTLDCGQIFRYRIEGVIAHVFSKDKHAMLITSDDRIEIETKDTDYFYNFFDLDTDYNEIKNTLRKDKFLSNAVDYGSGIRILKNDCFEMIVSFIISANNRIPRIKKSVEYLCSHFGSKIDNYYAFPTLEQLKKATLDDLLSAGLGFRAKHLLATLEMLTEEKIENLKTMPLNEQFKFLVDLSGIGEKVANCVLLFGLNRKDVFPVDTWINKVYNDLTCAKETNRAKITKELTNRYGALSGYAQQYFFYYYRDNNKK